MEVFSSRVVQPTKSSECLEATIYRTEKNKEAKVLKSKKDNMLGQEKSSSPSTCGTCGFQGSAAKMPANNKSSLGFEKCSFEDAAVIQYFYRVCANDSRVELVVADVQNTIRAMFEARKYFKSLGDALDAARILLYKI